MSKLKLSDLKSTALKVRENIIRMSVNGGSYIGSSFSCTDILVFLYKEFLNINKNNLNDPERDYFFLSKGHVVQALYALFAELDFIPSERLKNNLKITDFLYWHPNASIPGVEFHSGSLGHHLSIASGIALDCTIRQRKNRIVVLMGDGELNEGSVWESALVASSKKLDNLVAIVDRNKIQATTETEDLIKLEPLAEKFKSFGWVVRNADGHDFISLRRAFSKIPVENNKPTLIIANTVRGKGIYEFENKSDKWFSDLTQEEAENLIEKLKQKNDNLQQ